MQISNFPRVKLCYLPTPFHEAKRLSGKLDGPRIFFKRDDLISLGLGGNKVRKLEFLFGEALARDADVVLTTGPIQSNHARQVAAAAASLGLEAHLILQGEEPLEYKGNLLACYMFGAKLHFVKASTMDENVVAKRMEEIAEDLRKSGKKPYIIPIGGFTPQGSIGYAFATLEILYQANEAGVHIDYICHATSTGGTQAGLITGNKILRTGIKILGIRAAYEFEPFEERVSEEAMATLRLMGYPEISVKREEVWASRDYVGNGYDCPTKEAAEAMLLVAQTEGILLDPVYTGKAMAGLIDLCKKGFFSKKDVVVFLHTGGIPGLFVGPEFYGNDLVKR
jgi:L-cysteate sulfo-lyase